jgi:hypothetical protein
MNGAWILVIFVAVSTATLLYLLHYTRLGSLLRERISDRPRRRLLLANISFFITFAAVRTLAWSIHNHIGPFHDIHMRGRHIHHLVFGIFLLLIVGYGWLAEIGTGTPSSSLLVGRLMCLLYGAGAALVLDEFALWLNLQDVYWARQGRASVDAIVLFGSFLLISTLSAPLWRALTRNVRSQKPAPSKMPSHQP